MLKYTLILIINIYRYCISPYTPPCCRFYPTCSIYARDSILTFGPIKGCYLAARRLLKCHPFTAGGFDPVPSIKNQDI